MALNLTDVKLVTEAKPVKGQASMADLNPEFEKFFDAAWTDQQKDAEGTQFVDIPEDDHKEFAGQLKAWAAKNSLTVAKRWRDADPDNRYRWHTSTEKSNRGRPKGSKNKSNQGTPADTPAETPAEDAGKNK